MEVIRKKIKVDKEEYFKKHLEVINPFIPTKFTPMEMKVLTAFMNLEGEEVEETRFNPHTRKNFTIAYLKNIKVYLLKKLS